MHTALAGTVAFRAPTGALAGVGDLVAVGGASPLARAVASFVAVLLIGSALLVRSRGFVEGSVDTSLARPHVSVVYGVVGYGLIGFLGFVGLTQLSYVGLSGTVVGSVLVVLVAAAALVLTVVGSTVVGAGLVALTGDPRPWNGLVLGAAGVAAAWLLLPPLAAGIGWVLVAAVGVGGPIRAWIHAERTVATEKA